MLTENGKKWIAQNLGKKVDDKYCFDYYITYYWYDVDEKVEKTASDGTGGMVTILAVAHLIGKESEAYIRIGDKKYYYWDLKAGNDGNDITLDDAKWVAEHDGYPAGEERYCFTPAAPSPTPTPTPTEGTGLLCIYAKDKSTGEEVHAWIFIDRGAGEEFTGYSTPECLELAPGSVTIRVYHPLYEEQTKSASVAAGGQINVTFELEKIPPGKPIEIVVIEKCVSNEYIRPLLEPPYSDIPTTLMRGSSKRFRIYILNYGGYDLTIHGGTDKPGHLRTWLRLVHSTTGEEYVYYPIDADARKIIPAGSGESVRYDVTIPETASLGTYYLYFGWEINTAMVPPEWICK